MKDVKCPYCGNEQYICHDDGQGYSEDEIHQQWCGNCEKYFVYTTYISFHYDVSKADCLNGNPHKYKPTITYPKEFTRMRCVDCGEERPMTDKEMNVENI
jgi:ribosomal protein S27E